MVQGVSGELPQSTLTPITQMWWARFLSGFFPGACTDSSSLWVYLSTFLGCSVSVFMFSVSSNVSHNLSLRIRSLRLGLTYRHYCIYVNKIISNNRLDSTGNSIRYSVMIYRERIWKRIDIGLPFPSPGDLPNPGMEPTSPALAGRFFTTESPGKPGCYFGQFQFLTGWKYRRWIPNYFCFKISWLL